MPTEPETPEQVEAAFAEALRDPSHPLGNPRADSVTREQASNAFLERRRKALGTENRPSLHVDGRDVRGVPPREQLDLSSVPSEDHEAAKAFHEATDGPNAITQQWLTYAAEASKREPPGWDEAWEILNRQHGQGAGPLVWDARKAFDHPNFPASLRRFIERKNLENDPNVIGALARWHRQREGK